MNRRGFLHAMLAAGAAPAIVKAANIMPIFMRRESGLFIPSAGERPLLTIEMITKEALKILHENLNENAAFVTLINHQIDYWGAAKPLRVRVPNRYRQAGLQEQKETS